MYIVYYMYKITHIIYELLNIMYTYMYIHMSREQNFPYVLPSLI